MSGFALVNALGAAVNMACYVGLGHHWYNAAAVVLGGLTAVIAAIGARRG